jgi:Ca2+-binding RTX toxin-like protein
MDDYANDASTTALLDLSFADNFGAIDYAGDQDWLRMELAGGASYEIHVHGQDLGFQLAQPRIRIFDSASHLIAEGDSTDGAVLLTFTALSYGTHYLSMDSSDPAAIGTYNFHGFGDDNSGSARRAVNSQSSGALEYFTDEDGFTFKLIAGVNYTFDLRGQATGAGTLQDPLLLLRNSTGATLASDDDSGEGTDSRIVFTPTVSGDYTLAVRESGDDGVGSYTISSTAPLGLAIAAVSADQTEGNTGSKAFGFTFTRSGDLSTAIFVPWAVAGSGANPADAADFAGGVLPTGNIALAAGEASKTLAVNVRGDTQLEPDEGFLVTLSSPTHGVASASGLIRNDDGAPSVSIAATSASLNEGNSGETAFGFTVTRSGDLSAATSVAWTAAGSGASPANAADFTNGLLPSGNLAFAAGEASKALVVSVHGDTQLEPDEGFSVTLSAPTNGATLGTATAAGTIQNDDASLNAVNGTSNGETLTGTLGADQIRGLGGNDILVGRAGSDILDGGTGTDGADWVKDGGTLGVNADLAAGTATRGAEVDTLVNLEDLRGTEFADTLQGNGLANYLSGNAGADTLNGRGGNDVFAGGVGNNVLDGGSETDTVTYSWSLTGVSVDLGTDTATRGTETDRMFNVENVTGSNNADSIRGNNLANVLQGLGGNDALVGGAGSDTLTGGTGADRFAYLLTGDSPTGATTRDVIVDFSHSQGDRIDLSAIDANAVASGNQAFAFKGTGAITGVGQVHVVHAGGETIVEVNTTGTTAPELQIDLHGSLTLASSDFLL